MSLCKPHGGGMVHAVLAVENAVDEAGHAESL
jgi:hypothetical protein